MPTSREPGSDAKASTPNFVSGRFLTDFFRTLEANGIAATQLLGDLPISVTPSGEMHGDVEWSAFVEFMKRLEHEVGGSAGLEECASNIGKMRPAPILRGLAGFSASPQLLFRAAVRWALKRAMPGIEAWISQTGDNELHIHARIHEDLRACPQVFYFGLGASRGLPRILGLADAVIDADIQEREAHYRITLPPSPSIFARARRLFRTLSSAGSVLETIESQQLELHAQHDALRKAHHELRASEARYRALTDAAVDVLCELDLEGRIAFVSASAKELVGYTPEQITGSHYRLWIPKQFHARAAERFEALVVRPPGGAITRELVTLHADSGGKVVAELSVRSYVNSDGAWRLAAVLRDVTDLIAQETTIGDVRQGDALPLGFQPDVSRQTVSADAPATTRRAEDSIDHARLVELRSALALHRENAAKPASAGHSAHPVMRSLEMLIAALDGRRQDATSESNAALVRVAESMTRIVREVDAEKMQGQSGRETIELRKLIDAVALEFNGHSRSAERPLRCQIDTTVTEIQARSGLLSVGLANLLELAARRIKDGESILLTADEGINSAGDDALEFRIEVERSAPGGVGPDASASAGRRPNDSGNALGESEADADDEFWALSESVASDVAESHGGEVAIGSDAAGRPCFWLRIPTARPNAAD